VSEPLEFQTAGEEESRSKAGEEASLARFQGKREFQRQEVVSQEKLLLGREWVVRIR
jgi:hypothetical protein